MKRKPYSYAISLLTLSLIATGCTTAHKRNRSAVPEAYIYDAQIPHIPNARILGDEMPTNIQHILSMSPEEARQQFGGIIGTKHHYLALSGGGSNGAYGAGLLNGWTATGNRPKFVMVTGISAGAILAPWAFLGSDYDHVARELFTVYDTKAVVKERSLLTGLRSDAFTDSSPLHSIIYNYLGDAEIEKIASEHRNGRRLLVGTVNVDMMRPITWNMGEIACSDSPDKRQLMTDIILASASIPVAFPPIFIDVEAHGEIHQEMHVDGGLGRQVFFYPEDMHWDEIMRVVKPAGTPEIYVIRNAKLDPKWEAVDASVFALGGRSLSSLIRTQGIGDIYKIYLAAKRDGLAFNLAYIPKEFSNESKEPFDRTYMKALYDVAYKSITEGDPWIKKLD